ncbi:MAG: hypothetical protein QNJ90_15415 [Planctomycetota bacterium]|nr:hypothetical protein [Planctomycetota bacterium]
MAKHKYRASPSSVATVQQTTVQQTSVQRMNVRAAPAPRVMPATTTYAGYVPPPPPPPSITRTYARAPVRTSTPMRRAAPAPVRRAAVAPVPVRKTKAIRRAPVRQVSAPVSCPPKKRVSKKSYGLFSSGGCFGGT